METIDTMVAESARLLGFDKLKDLCYRNTAGETTSASSGETATRVSARSCSPKMLCIRLLIE